MMLQDLKKELESGTFAPFAPFALFVYKDIDFIPKQYINRISKILNLPITHIDEIKVSHNKDIFGVATTPSDIRLFETDEFIEDDVNLTSEKNLFVICKKVKNESLYNNYIINVPVLEKWQIEDYACSIADGMTEKDINKLVNLCGYNIYRIEQELKKIKLFSVKEQQYIFQSLLDDGAFNDMSSYTIFNFTTALLRKDKQELLKIINELDRIDIDPPSLIAVLYRNLKNIIRIQMAKNPTPETVGLTPKQFYAVKKSVCGFYHPTQLVQLYLKVTDLENQIKSGILPHSIIIDYIIQYFFAV